MNKAERGPNLRRNVVVDLDQLFPPSSGRSDRGLIGRVTAIGGIRVRNHRQQGGCDRIDRHVRRISDIGTVVRAIGWIVNIRAEVRKISRALRVRGDIGRTEVIGSPLPSPLLRPEEESVVAILVITWQDYRTTDGVAPVVLLVRGLRLCRIVKEIPCVKELVTT